MKNFLSLLIIFFTFNLIAQFPTSVHLTEYANGLEEITEITHANDQRLFVCTKQGLIHIIDENSNLLADPFLDIRDMVDNFSEGGLLSLAFHPNYSVNGWFYIFYFDRTNQVRISRFTVNDSEPDKADITTEKNILSYNKETYAHFGGCLRFGPEGYLYVSIGDDFTIGIDKVQDLYSFEGKILRIDIDGGDPYSIPDDNPYVSNDEALDEIWAIGLRNPWRFSFDKSSGDLWLTDVGEKAYEEINFIPVDNNELLNFGWPCYEGPIFTDLDECNNPNQNFTHSTSGYIHNYDNCSGSITGGYLYRGLEESLNNFGAYICADFCTGKIYAVYQENGNYTIDEILKTNKKISTIGENKDGELFVADYFTGEILKLNFNCKLPEIKVIDTSCPSASDGCVEIIIPENENIIGVELRDSNSAIIDVSEYCNLSSGSFVLRSINTDANCTVDINFTIQTFDPIIISTLASDCIEPDGGFKITSDQILNDYFSYRVENDNGEVIDTSDYLSVPSGTYSLIAENDSLGCLYSEEFSITYNNLIPVMLDNGELSVLDTFASYQWLFLNPDSELDTIVGANEHTYTPTAPIGVYWALMTGFNDCEYLSFVRAVTVLTSNEELGLESNLILSPNPASDLINIIYDIKNNSPIEISILSIEGELVYEKLIRGINQKVDEQIQLGNLPTGVYVLRLTNGENEVSEIFVKN